VIPEHSIMHRAIIALCLLLALAAPAAMAATTELHVVRYAADGVTILNETTVDYTWLEENLPVQGDGVTHYYHQGPVFEGDKWNPEEDTNVREKDMGAVKGTDLKDICDLVGGMKEGETVRIKASDGLSRVFPYRNVYEPEPRQGPMVITWYHDEDGYVPDYRSGMRLVFFADTSTNPYGVHAFGVWDMHECFDEEYWYFYGGEYPTTTGLSVQYISEVFIYSNEELTGSVYVSSIPAGAAIYLDGIDTGLQTNATLEDVPVGEHTIELRLSGYQSVTMNVTVEMDECSRPDPVVLTPLPPEPDIVISLEDGWNFVSTPKRLMDGSDTFAAIYDSIDTAGHSILLYDGLTQEWKAAASADAFKPLDGVWIYATEACTVPLTFAPGGPQVPPTKSLGKGWNAIGFTDTVPESAANTLLSLGDHWTTLIGFDAGSQEYEISIVRGATGRHGEERTMEPMQGYWVYMTGARTLAAIGA